MVGTIVTTKGRILIAKIMAMEGSIHFTRAAVGTGNIPNGYDSGYIRDLNKYKMDGKITGASSNQETASISFQIASKDVEEGFVITEAGLYAEDPDEGEILYAYLDMKDDPQYIYPRGGNVNKVAEITLGVIIGQVGKITAMISPGGLVTKEEFEQLEQKTDTCKARMDVFEAGTDQDIDEIIAGTYIDDMETADPEQSEKIGMRGITKDLLNRFWKKGVKPIMTAIAGKLDVAKIINNLLTTEEGYALDARQGKVLQDQIDELNTGKAASSHTHDERYYTESEVDSKLASKSDSGHIHAYLPLSGGTMTGNLTISNGKGLFLPGNSYIGGSDATEGYNGLAAFRDKLIWLFPEGWRESKSIARSVRFHNETDSYGWVYSNIDNYYNLGTSSLRWKQIYAVNSAISTSDETQKKDITSLDDDLTMKFIMGLNPISYIRTDAESGRKHWGMGAQSVEKLMVSLGISSMDFAGLIKSPKEESIPVEVEYYEEEQVEEVDENGQKVITTRKVRKTRWDMEQRIVPNEYIYGLRYEEFIAPVIKVEQIHQKKLTRHDEVIRKLQERVGNQDAEIREMRSAMMEMRKRMEEMVAQYTRV